MKYKNLVYLSFSSPMAALSVVDNLPAESQVLEVGQLHAGHVTVWVSVDSNILVGGVAEATDGVFLENPKADLLKGYFKQKNTQVTKNLLTLESSKLSTLLGAVDHLLKNTSYEMIEISRGVNGQALAKAYLANGKAEEALMTANSDLHVRLFEEPGAQLLKLFNV